MKQLLAQITVHEETCRYRKMKCVFCKTEVPVIELDTHNKDCVTPVSPLQGNILTAEYNLARGIVEWDGIGPVVFTIPTAGYRPTVTTWEGVKFYLMAGLAEGKLLIYAGVDGNIEVVKKYKLEVSLLNPENKRMEMVSVSDLVPVDMIFKPNQVRESGKVGLVAESVLQRYFSKEEGNVNLVAKYNIKKW